MLGWRAIVVERMKHTLIGEQSISITDLPTGFSTSLIWGFYHSIF
jgi:hypothetical protein